MSHRFSPAQLLRFAGLIIWATIGLPIWMLTGTAADEAAAVGVTQAASEGHPSWEAWAVWLAAGASYAWLSRALGARKPGGADYLLLAVLMASSIALSHYTASGLGSLLLMVAACVLPWMLPLRAGVVTLVLSELVIVPVYMSGVGLSLGEAVMQAMMYIGVTGFVFVNSLVARQQAHAREEQRRLNSELRATRALLAESVRVNERTRIARELHDLLGHHLTALSMNLEVAGHLSQGAAREHVQQAHTLARLLLADVREAVGQLRDSERIDLAASLRLLLGNVPGLDVELRMPEPFAFDDPELAHVILRCTQELITNTVRHAQATYLNLDYVFADGGIRLQARDNGRGVTAPTPGNGLQGMRERVAALGGTLHIHTAPEQGFAVTVWLPCAPEKTPSASPSVAEGSHAPPPATVQIVAHASASQETP